MGVDEFGVFFKYELNKRIVKSSKTVLKGLCIYIIHVEEAPYFYYP